MVVTEGKTACDPGRNGVHGLNEQIGVKELYAGREFLYRLVKALAAKRPPGSTRMGSPPSAVG